MLFSVETKMKALLRSEDRCECISDVCGDHDERCQESIQQGKWKAWAKVAGGPETLDNCELICHSCAEHRETEIVT